MRILNRYVRNMVKQVAWLDTKVTSFQSHMSVSWKYLCKRKVTFESLNSLLHLKIFKG